MLAGPIPRQRIPPSHSFAISPFQTGASGFFSAEPAVGTVGGVEGVLVASVLLGPDGFIN